MIPFQNPPLSLKQKIEQLQKLLQELAPVAVAFSGGVDSGYLSLMAYNTLQNQAIAVTANSETFPTNELEICRRVAKEIGIPHFEISTQELKVGGFRENQVSRCYFCKQELYEKIHLYLQAYPGYTVLDGSIADDVESQRPGMQAAKKLGVRSPLREVGLTKQEIRQQAQILGLSIWNKPALACLSSRIPYGTEVTLERIQRVQSAEEILKKLGFLQCRVRYYEKTARLEVLRDDFARILEHREFLKKTFQEIGFTEVTLDLKGFRSGSMHEVFQMQADQEGIRSESAKALWREFGIEGNIKQKGNLTQIETNEMETLFTRRESLVQTFHQEGLPYLVLKI